MEIFLSALFFAFLFTLILSFTVERDRNPKAMGSFFLLLFLPLWTLALIVPAQGPIFYGAAIIDIFFLALFVFLIIAAATPPHYYRMRRNLRHRDLSSASNKNLYPKDEARDSRRALNVFFWGLLVFLGLALIISSL